MPSERVVPIPVMDNMPISRLDELQTHLTELASNPDTPLNAQLLDQVELQLTEHNIPPLLPTLLAPVIHILRTNTTQDPSPLLSMAVKLLSPLPFTRVLAVADVPSILSALGSPLPGANLLALAILHKAARSPADAAILSTLPDLFAALVARWLDARDVGVGERAARVLGDLLDTDCDVVAGVGSRSSSSSQAQNSSSSSSSSSSSNPPANGINGIELAVASRREPGHGRLWHLLLDSQAVFAIIPELCGGPSSMPAASAAAAAGSERTEHQTSISQGRLLRLLPRLAALNMHALAHTDFPSAIPLPQTLTQATGHGLLQWAALAMVDKSDVLMHLSLIDFFETFLSVMRVAAAAGGSAASDGVTRALVKAATANDEQLRAALLGLPDRTVEEESEQLRIYINQLLQ